MSRPATTYCKKLRRSAGCAQRTIFPSRRRHDGADCRSANALALGCARIVSAFTHASRADATNVGHADADASSRAVRPASKAWSAAAGGAAQSTTASVAIRNSRQRHSEHRAHLQRLAEDKERHRQAAQCMDNLLCGLVRQTVAECLFGVRRRRRRQRRPSRAARTSLPPGCRDPVSSHPQEPLSKV